jgi:hypothetical protein
MESGAGLPRGSIHRTVAVFFVAGALLNGENLLRSAERMEHGTSARAVCVAVARPLAAVTRALHLGALRRTVETWVDAVGATAP